MGDAAGEAESADLRVDFDRRVKLAFHRSSVSSDSGLIAFRKLDDALGLTDLAGEALTDVSGRWIDAVGARRPGNVVVLDRDSSVSPTYGEQEGTASGHS